MLGARMNILRDENADELPIADNLGSAMACWPWTWSYQIERPPVLQKNTCGKGFSHVTTWILLGLGAAWTISLSLGNFCGRLEFQHFGGVLLTDLVDSLPIQGHWAMTNAATYAKGQSGKAVCIKVVPFFWAITISDVIIDGLWIMKPSFCKC